MKTILMNGCYDVIHVGHIRSFNQALEYGTRLIVAINSDRAIRQLKGNSRPINVESDRAEFLRSIRGIDDVVVFDSTDVSSLLASLKPDVWVKSGYTKDTVDKKEYEIAKNLGIRVVFLPVTQGLSTTEISQKLMRED